MNRADVGLVLGLAGFLLGGWAVYVANDARRETTGRWNDTKDMVDSDNETIAGLGATVQQLTESQKALSDRVDRLQSDPEKLWEKVNSHESRLQKLESGDGIIRLAPSKEEPPKDEEKK